MKTEKTKTTKTIYNPIPNALDTITTDLFNDYIQDIKEGLAEKPTIKDFDIALFDSDLIDELIQGAIPQDYDVDDFYYYIGWELRDYFQPEHCPCDCEFAHFNPSTLEAYLYAELQELFKYKKIDLYTKFKNMM